MKAPNQSLIRKRSLNIQPPREKWGTPL
jgi:hypothetical protein